MSPSAPLMFHRLAPYYDLLVAGKDYGAECDRLKGLLARYGRSGGRDWLDVGCGTGRHLELLRSEFHVEGVDASREMLRIARRRLPGVRLHLGDMRTFHLARSFDVVSCLYSAIGHLRSEDDVLRTFRNFAAHLRPGGIAVVEPWIDPADFRSGFVHVASQETGPVRVARMSYSRTRGAHSRVEYRYLIGREGLGIEEFSETDVGLLVPRRRLLELLERAGLEPRFLRAGLTPGRGLLLGRRPRASPSRTAGSGRRSPVRGARPAEGAAAPVGPGTGRARTAPVDPRPA